MPFNPTRSPYLHDIYTVSGLTVYSVLASECYGCSDCLRVFLFDPTDEDTW